MSTARTGTAAHHGETAVLATQCFDGPNSYLPSRALLAKLDPGWIAGLADSRGRLQAGVAARLQGVLLEHFRMGRRLTLSRDTEQMLSGQPSVERAVALVTVELQHLAGERVGPWHVLGAPGAAMPPAIVLAFETRAIAMAAVGAACHLVGAACSGIDPVEHASIARFRAAVLRHGLDNTMRAVVTEARRRAIPVLRPDENRPCLQLGHGREQRSTHNLLSDRTSQIGTMLAGHKNLTALLLARLGLPTPPQAMVATAADAIDAARRIGYPVVVKPEASAQARGVRVGLDSDSEVAMAFAQARRYDGGVLVEAFIAGVDHRLMVIGGRLVSTAARRPARVTGDGATTVAGLIATLNSDPERGAKGRAAKATIAVDGEVRRVLARQGLTLESIPEAGATADLRLTSNLSTGGDAEIVDHLVHPDNRRMTELIARAAGLDVVGIDLLTPDISRPFHAVRCAVTEINTQPGLGPFTMPGRENAAVVEAMVDLLFPAGDPGAMPCVLLLGGDRAEATARALHDRLREAGRQPARAGRSGLAVGGIPSAGPPLSGGRDGAEALLCHPRADTGILTITPDAWRDHGTGLETWRVLVLRDAGLHGCRRAAAGLAAIHPCPVIAETALARVLDELPAERLILIDDGSPSIARHKARGGRTVADQDVPQRLAELLAR